MSGDRHAGEDILATTTDSAREVFGDRLSAVFALGSLAHGGFAPLVSDVDVALILNDLSEDTADLVGQVKQLSIARTGDPLAHRLSIFWSDWHGVRHGPGDGTRLPAVDRLDLLDDGRLLHGVDQRANGNRPDRTELVVDGARFACAKFDDQYLADLHRPELIAAEGPRAATKAALFPIRFLYTLDSGLIGKNDAAAHWYQRTGAHPALAEAAMTWRENGITDPETATRLLREHLIGVYDEFFDAYRTALLALGNTTTADELSSRHTKLHGDIAAQAQRAASATRSPRNRSPRPR